MSRTRAPAPASCAATRPPTWPVAPVTAISAFSGIGLRLVPAWERTTVVSMVTNRRPSGRGGERVAQDVGDGDVVELALDRVGDPVRHRVQRDADAAPDRAGGARVALQRQHGRLLVARPPQVAEGHLGPGPLEPPPAE